MREVHSVIADKWIDNTKTELQKTHKLMDLIVDVENGVVSSSKEIPTIQNLATATSTATLCTEPSVSRAPSVTTLGNNASDTLNALESAFTYYTGALWHEFTSEFETDLLIWKQMQHAGVLCQLPPLYQCTNSIVHLGTIMPTAAKSSHCAKKW